MAPPGATNFISDAISRHGSKKYQNGHLCVSGLKLLATTVLLEYAFLPVKLDAFCCILNPLH